MVYLEEPEQWLPVKGSEGKYEVSSWGCCSQLGQDS